MGAGGFGQGSGSGVGGARGFRGTRGGWELRSRVARSRADRPLQCRPGRGRRGFRSRLPPPWGEEEEEEPGVDGGAAGGLSSPRAARAWHFPKWEPPAVARAGGLRLGRKA